METKELVKVNRDVTSNVVRVLRENPGIFKRVDDIEVPDILFHPLKTGTPEFDRAFSEMGGVTPSCVTLVTGTPGAGKTTLMATLGSRIQTPKPIVFLSYEMSDFQLKLTAKKIQGFEKMLIVTENFHKERESFEEFLNGALTNLDPGLLIVDSLQKMAGIMPGSFDKNQIWLTEKLTEFAKKTFCPVTMIGHVSKDGTYKGPTTIKHEVDAHMHIYIDKELGERCFSFSKNRFGGVADPYFFRITSNGVFIGNEWWDKPGTDVNLMVKDSIVEFRKASESQHTVPAKEFQLMAKTVVKWLESEYKNELLMNTAFKKDTIALAWKGTRAFCRPAQGMINFGEKFVKTLTSDNFRNVGYRAEKAYMNRQLRNKEDMALWIICHEWLHLFSGNDKHTKAFFAKIENMWIQHKEILMA